MARPVVQVLGQLFNEQLWQLASANTVKPAPSFSANQKVMNYKQEIYVVLTRGDRFALEWRSGDKGTPWLVVWMCSSDECLEPWRADLGVDSLVTQTVRSSALSLESYDVSGSRAAVFSPSRRDTAPKQRKPLGFRQPGDRAALVQLAEDTGDTVSFLPDRKDACLIQQLLNHCGRG